MYTRPESIADLTVLIIDDDELIRELVKGIAIRAGVGTVQSAPNGNMALTVLGRRVIHGVFCDIDMPGITGLEVLDRVRRGDIPMDKGFAYPVPVQLPVIMLTGHSQENTVEMAVRRGATGYVTKPVKPAAIKKGLERMLEEWRDVPINELRFKRVQLPGFTRFVLSGQLIPRNQNVIRDMIKEIGTDQNTEIAIDLSNVPFIDEFGYGTLLILNGFAKSKGKTLSVITESDEIKKSLMSVRISQLIGVFPTNLDYARHIMSKRVS